MKDTASSIIKRMVRLKNSDRTRKKEFYLKWNELRNALHATKEYQLFLNEVRALFSYRCGECGKHGREVHHKIRVYDDPTKALEVSNGMFLCSKCHRAQHKKTPKNKIDKPAVGKKKKPARQTKTRPERQLFLKRVNSNRNERWP